MSITEPRAAGCLTRGAPSQLGTGRAAATSGRLIRFVQVALLLILAVSTSGCFLRRPDWTRRTYPAAVPLPDGTRAQLAERVAQMEQELAAGRLKGDAQATAQRELAELQRRLAQGDFVVGDQMAITVTDLETQVDTATVREGLVVSFASFPDVSLAGVLRSEVQQRLQSHVDRYRKEHRVRVTLLTRLQVLGAVTRPGYYSISPDRPVTDVIMLAGGPTPLSRIDRVMVRRGNRLIMKPSQWRDAIARGATVGDVGLQPGDRVEMEGRGQRMAPWQVGQLVFLGVSATFALIQLLSFIYREPE